MNLKNRSKRSCWWSARHLHKHTSSCFQWPFREYFLEECVQWQPKVFRLHQFGFRQQRRCAGEIQRCGRSGGRERRAKRSCVWRVPFLRKGTNSCFQWPFREYFPIVCVQQQPRLFQLHQFGDLEELWQLGEGAVGSLRGRTEGQRPKRNRGLSVQHLRMGTNSCFRWPWQGCFREECGQ